MKYDYELMEKEIERLIKENGKIIKIGDLGKFSNLIPKCPKSINKHYNTKYGKGYIAYYTHTTDYCYSGVYSAEMTYEEVLKCFENFIKTKNKFPTVSDITKENGFIKSSSAIISILNRNGEDLNTIAKKFNLTRNSRYEGYEYWVSKYKELCNGKVINSRKLTDLGLPNARWYVKKCPNPLVTNYNTFVEYEIRVQPSYHMSKKMATEIILKAFDELGEDNLTKTNLSNYICESIINRIWGSFNNMKRDLKLKILGENMKDKHIKYNDVLVILLKECKNISSKKEYITTADISKYCPIKFGTIERTLKKNNTCVREVLTSNGFKYQESGTGMVNHYNDGEITKSTYEYEFTNCLREIGYVYNKDYFRDVRYRNFIDNYNGLLDCDYEIHVDNKVIYIEIAGMLRDYEKYYKEYDIENIKSNRKKTYIKHLRDKQSMLENNNIEHLILFPSDLDSKDKIINIINNKLNGLKEEI